MKLEKLNDAYEKAIVLGEIEDLSDEDLGAEVLIEVGELSENAILATSKFLGRARTKRSLKALPKKVFSFIKEWVRRLICDFAYDQIDTPEERRKIAEKYDDEVVNAVIAAFPYLILARPLLVRIARVLIAQGLALAAKGFDNYCSV